MYSDEKIRRSIERLRKGNLKQIYYKHLKEDIVAVQAVISSAGLRLFLKYIDDFAVIPYCRLVTNITYVADVFQYFKNSTDKFRLSSAVLVSSPYSEPMNYLSITIYLLSIWRYMETNLEQLKHLTEILKFSMITGCASNFLIYIAMSEKLRDALNWTIKCREN